MALEASVCAEEAFERCVSTVFPPTPTTIPLGWWRWWPHTDITSMQGTCYS